MSDCFRTIFKFPPKQLTLTPYQECKPVQSLARQQCKQHPYLPPCLDIIYSALFHFCGYTINGTMSVLSNYRGVQPAFAYNQHLVLEKILGVKVFLMYCPHLLNQMLTRFEKSYKNCKPVNFCLNIRFFYWLVHFFFFSFHPNTPGLLVVL